MQAWQLKICADKAATIAQTIAMWQQWAADAIAERGFFSVALAGGGTPKALYEALADVQDFPWDKTYVFWGDERYVPPTDSDSNYRMAKEALLDRVPIPPTQIFPMPTGANDPATDAAAYTKTLKQIFDTPYPTIDCTLLGVGGDGHTASLFPGTEALKSQDWVTVGNKSGDPRLTLTFPAIASSHRVMFWILGSGKADIVKTLLTDPVGFPAQTVQCNGDLFWMCDREAAAHLPLIV